MIDLEVLQKTKVSVILGLKWFWKAVLIFWLEVALCYQL